VTLIDGGHPIRSSWGESRIARLAYDDPLYVRMMQRAFVLWDELARDMGRTLMLKAGSLDITPKACHQYDIMM
jgi:sarcosine oxidase